MDRINQYLEKVYLVGFENQDTLTFNQGVTGSNPLGSPLSNIESVEKPNKVLRSYPLKVHMN